MRILKQTATELVIEHDAVRELFGNPKLIPIVTIIFLAPAGLLPLLYWHTSFPKEIFAFFFAFLIGNVLFTLMMPMLSALLQIIDTYTFDKSASQLTLESKEKRFAVQKNRVRQWHLSEILDVELSEFKDLKWRKFYQIKLLLKTGGFVALTSIRHRQTCVVADSLREFLDL